MFRNKIREELPDNLLLTTGAFAILRWTTGSGTTTVSLIHPRLQGILSGPHLSKVTHNGTLSGFNECHVSLVVVLLTGL
jgi:hypothetical protein